jgi:amidase
MSQSEKDKPSSAATLTRRAFVGTTIAGGVLAAAQPVLPSLAGAVEKTGQSTTPAFDLAEVTIAELQTGMKSGKYTSRQLVEKYIARIYTINQRGPALNHVLEINPQALTIADNLDAERKAKGPRGPLHGIPILIKDNIATADSMQTTAGSLALSGSKVPRDAFVVERLREAGAVLLGKTNLSEWANFRSTHSSSGWSARGGQCRNPYALDRTPSGSSSGSGVAVAVNTCAVAVGTETDGSIVSPSTVNGIVGIKPTLGLLSRSGIVPIAHSQDTPGPMARTVADAAILLGAMTGIDVHDEATPASQGKSFNEYAQFLQKDGLRGARIGVAREKLMGYSPAADKLIEAALGVMKQLGAVIVDPANIATAGKLDDSEFEVLLYEFKADLNKYLAEFASGAPVHLLKEIIAFNEKLRDKELIFFGQEIMEMAEKKGDLNSADYLKALAKNQQLSQKEGIDATMDQFKLDAIVCPTSGPAALIDLVNGDPSGGGSSSTHPAVAGYPHITVPAGFADGLPVGISFFGRAFTEPTLIKFAYAYEQATKHRRPPKFHASAVLPQSARRQSV